MSQPYHIIIADDERPIAELIEQLILDEYPAVTITCTFNGQAALDAYLSTSADLIILDINMPFLTGIQVTQILRVQGDAVPIILVSAALNQLYDTSADQHTVFCAKPLNLEMLLATVQQLLLLSP